MLKNVYLKNLAIIREAEIDFEPCLNIMTGETGSGKSIIINSINIALGDKASKGIIRSGCDFGLIELTFVTDDPDILGILDNLGISRDGKSITVSRKITADSSISKINGETTTLAGIRSLTSHLIDIHGQHDHQSLLNSARHVDILDEFGADTIDEPKSRFRKCLEEYRSLKKEYAGYNLDQASLAAKISLLEHEKGEIERAELTEGEDTSLEDEFRKLSAWEKLSGFVAGAYDALTDEANGAAGSLAKALSELSFAASLAPEDKRLATLKSTLTDIDSVTKDLNRDIAEYIEDNSLDRMRLEEIGNRLNLINRLKSKFGNTIEAIHEYYTDVAKKLDGYSDYFSKKSEIESLLARGRGELNHLAGELSDARKAAAERLAPMIISNLKDLNFLNVGFSIEFGKTGRITENGFDRVEFLISTNEGERLAPLAKIASGGELSRIMLAIKSSVSEKDAIPTLVFDEIDTGISGRTAQMVAKKLNALCRNHQIICITHLPQIAAMADTHFRIHKEAAEGTTISGIEKLGKQEELTELAKLLSGREITTATIENARELKEQAAQIKREEHNKPGM
ncbi:MAG: DNA repair protein RecN [Lachnospiraceae bacterium]|jgi:DNA repair protein RecN (Recombination protein N)